MNSKVYKCCAVPQCKSTSIATPNKVFVHVPSKKIIRDKWLKVTRRTSNPVTNSSLYFCEDHFDLPNDMENYMEYHVMGSVSQVRTKPGCMPKKFICQPESTPQTLETMELPYLDKRKMMTLKGNEKQFQDKNRVTKQANSEEITSSNSGSETESEYETRAPEPLNRKKRRRTDVVHKKCVRTSSRKDVKPSGAQSTNNKSLRLKKAPKTSAERAREYRARKALLKQQSKQKQESDAKVEIATEDIRSAGSSEINQVPESSEIRKIERRAKSAEATWRRREKVKGVSDPSKQPAKTAAQRMREYRKRKKLFSTNASIKQKWVCTVQVERCDDNWIQTKCSTNCPEHFKQEDKDTPLNGYASQKNTIPVVEGTAEMDKCVIRDSYQHVLKDLYSSDRSKESCSQTVLTLKRKIKEDCALLKRQDEGILGIHTEVEIKQDLEDAEDPVSSLSSASCSRTNTASGSPTTESNTEWFPEYEPQNTVDVITMKEEPGSPLSDISTQSDAAVCQEQAVQNQLTKKIEMLHENEQVLKRLREEISIFENKHEELLADIKYLQNVSKKKIH